MKVDLYTYTGTGNSLWIARLLAERLGGSTAVRPIAALPPGPVADGADAVGICFPVHIWGVPRRVTAFLDALPRDAGRYNFAVAVNAGQVAATLVQLQRLMQARGLHLNAGFQVVMPSNYIPWGGPGPKDRQTRLFGEAREKCDRIAAAVARRANGPVEKGPWWQNVLFTPLNRLAFPRVPSMDRRFWSDGKCDGCGVCKAVCPAGNIDLRDGRPAWIHRCEQCLACLQWCPREAIQFGTRTPRYERYHHPDIRLGDVVIPKRTGAGAGPEQRTRPEGAGSWPSRAVRGAAERDPEHP